MSTVRLIPQPTLLPVLKDGRSLTPLRKTMAQTHTSQQFACFTDAARKALADIDFPEGKTADDVSLKTWERLTNQVAKHHASIASYNNYWPLRIYVAWRAMKYIARLQRSGRENPKATAGLSQSIPPKRRSSRVHKPIEKVSQTKGKRSGAVVADPTPRKRRRYFVGKPPPGVTGPVHWSSRSPGPFDALSTERPSKVNLPSVSEDSTSAKASSVLCSDSDLGEFRKSRSLSPLSLRAVTLPISPPADPARALAAPMSEPPSPSQERIAIRCPKCPFMPDITESQLTELRAFLASPDDSTHLGSSSHSSSTGPPPYSSCSSARPEPPYPPHLLPLRAAGLSTDVHFRLLQEISPWLKMVLVRRLNILVALSQPRPQPGKAEEEAITDPAKPLSLLEDVMQLESREKFQEIVTHMHDLAQPYLTTYFPTPKELEDTVLLIAHEKPIYAQFEHYWPVRFYIKRMVRKLGNKPLDERGGLLLGGLDTQVVPRSSRWNPPHQKTSRVPLEPGSLPNLYSNCPMHCSVDTSSVARVIQEYLHHRGLHEFIPLLALIGVTTSKQFVELCGLAEEVKGELFSDPRLLYIDPFQKICLQAEFTKEKLAGEGYPWFLN